MRWPGMKSSSLSEAVVVNKANEVSFLEIWTGIYREYQPAGRERKQQTQKGADGKRVTH